MNVLLIDDDPAFAQPIIELLYQDSNQIVYCDNMIDAINVISKAAFDLIILDLMLPPSYSNEGLEVLQYIRNCPIQSKVLMISTKDTGMISIVDKAYQLGATRFIDKQESDCQTQIILAVKEIKKEMSDSIFISHGHADTLKYMLKDFVREKLGRNCVILAEQPNNGLTIVEKLEIASEKCNKAIILLTKDDEMSDGKMRGRQNVIHEIGFFQGKYGRKNVILLCEEGVELFTNISGIVYIQFNRDHFPEVFESLRNELSISL